MTDLQNGIISLIRSAVYNCPVVLPENFDWEKAFLIGKKHQILSMLYYGVVNSDLKPPENLFNQLEMAAYVYLSVDQRQQYEISRLECEFNNNNIDYLLLKGINLKHIYPKSDMRMMSDADILIRTEQYEEIKNIIASLGFTEITESDHEFIWKKDSALNLELHKRLIPSYNKDYYSYFGDGWKLANKTEAGSSRYIMSREDEFVYLFTHFSKHYRDAGIGIKHLVDLKIFVAENHNLNFNYIYNELDKLELLSFYKNIDRTIKAWFENKNSSEITDFITNIVFDSGAYGTADAHTVSDAVKASKSCDSVNMIKSRKLSNLIFLPYKNMCHKYSVLKKFPVLLPLFWVVRAVSSIRKSGKIKKQTHRLKLISSKNITNYQQALNYVGLDFNFKE